MGAFFLAGTVSGSLLCVRSIHSFGRLYDFLICLRRQDDLYFSRQHQLVDTRHGS